MLNVVVLTGRLTDTPELKTTGSGTSVCSFSIAVERRYKSGEERQADFINIVTWRATAEFVSKYFKKGSLIIVFGSVQIDTWTDRNGVEHRTPNIMVDEVQFGESKSSGGSRSFERQEEPKKEGDAYSNALDNEFFADIKDIEGELPF